MSKKQFNKWWLQTEIGRKDNDKKNILTTHSDVGIHFDPVA